ncbi:winged helix-turn-helix domain-containing protein [Tahibacter soli]|uniref:Winged helix-turn-helix domain-containing protein n=1 Tax=Tahibacter soli TaxID=2983605 RepID=A0A9X3YQ00_9GAMM|nr:winged helix-turn-helix domain-containing protein [Tahibacter soli]MDC8014823.1 winged helix-turn-helix domain-containing protein [Tahibacter soli]
MMIPATQSSAPAVSRLRQESQRRLNVGTHVVDIGSLRVLDHPDGLRLSPKAAAVLLELAHRPNSTVSRDELLATVWRDTCPTPDVLTQAVTELRRAFGDDAAAPRYIETLPKLGYRLIAATHFSDVELAPREETIAGTRAPASNGEIFVPDEAPSRLPQLLVAACLGALTVAAVLAVFRHYAAPAALVPRWQMQEWRALTAEPGPERYPAISPDGTRVAFSSGDATRHNARLVVRSVDSPRTVQLSQFPGAEEYYPVWSPDGARIAFLRFTNDAGCQVVVAPGLGGEERVLRPCFNREINNFSWAPDGSHLVTTMFSGVQRADLAVTRISLDDGAATTLDYAHAPDDKDIDARYSPDGRFIAFRRGLRPFGDFWVMPANGGAPRQLTFLASRIRGFDWTRDGRALVFSSNHEGEQALYVVDVEDGRIQPLGLAPAQFPSAARDRDTIVYEIARVRTQLARLPLDGKSPATDVLPSTANDSLPALSPVDARLAYVSTRSGRPQVWLHDPAYRTAVALTELADGLPGEPVWRADGKRLLVVVRGKAHGGLVEIDLATRKSRAIAQAGDAVRYAAYGAGADRYLVVEGDAPPTLVELSPNGRRVLARGVGRVEYDAAAGAIWFTRTTERGLFRLDPNGRETLVTNEVSQLYPDGWRSVGGTIFYFQRAKEDGRTQLHRLEPSTGEDRTLASFDEPPADLAFSIAASRDAAVIVKTPQFDNDVGMFTLRRSPQ